MPYIAIRECLECRKFAARQRGPRSNEFKCVRCGAEFKLGKGFKMDLIKKPEDKINEQDKEKTT